MKSNLKTLTLATSIGDNDDDDFQNPSEAIAITQNLILSSLKNPSGSQVLKPSNGSPPRKKLKPSVTNGKENRRISRAPRFNQSRALNFCEERKVGKEESMNLSAPIGSGPVRFPPIAASNCCFSSEIDRINPIGAKYDERDEVKEEKTKLMENGKVGEFFKGDKGSCYSMSIESRLLKSILKSDSSNTGDGCEGKSGLLTPSESKLVGNQHTREFDFKSYQECDDDTEGLKEENGSSYKMSIESRLLESRMKSESSNGGDDCGDFEPGTQLNVLLDLCCEVGKESNSNCRDLLLQEHDLCLEPSELEEDGLLKCPLCGLDITELSEELRQVHTNNCLDNDGTPEVAILVDKIKAGPPQQVVDLNPVLEWLRKLGLSRYEDAFVREEIDWDSLQWLTEEDLLGIGVVALGPRKKLVHALSELRQRDHHGLVTENNTSNTTTSENTKVSVPGNKLITEYFQGPAIHMNSTCNHNRPLQRVGKTTKKSIPKGIAHRSHVSRGKVRDMPPWCCIPGTPFRVDAFRFLRGDCSHWFLTHFHLDHYQGLTKNFCHGKIYCCSVTAHLVNMKIGVPWERLQILPLNQKINIAGVNVTCIDANHCPGSIVILFEPSNGKAVLHTGDFRFSSEMARSPILQSSHIDTLILDTTYCNPQYDFPKQEAIIQFVIEAIQAEAFNPKTLFLIGTYTIGKERLFLEVARLLKEKVYVGAAKLRLLRCLGLPEEDMQWFTANEMESHIHVVPMWTIASFKRMKHFSSQYSGRFNLIVAFSPTGWTFCKGKKKTPGRRWQQGTIIRYEVPYSEHCSFTELREFVQFISPEHIIPSVNNKGPESADAMIALLMSDS